MSGVNQFERTSAVMLRRTVAGTPGNPANRFEKIILETDADQSSFHSDSTGWNPNDDVPPRMWFQRVINALAAHAWEDFIWAGV